MTMIKLLICSAVFVLFTVSLEPSKEYGPFSLHVYKFELCKGPKRQECCNITARMTNEIILSYYMNIKEDVTLTRGKIFASMNGKPLVRFQMKNPCDHLFMKPLLKTLLNVTDNCAVTKGKYQLNVNINTVAQKYYSGMFLYGNMTFKSVFYNEDSNFSCTIVHVELMPKKYSSQTRW